MDNAYNFDSAVNLTVENDVFAKGRATESRCKFRSGSAHAVVTGQMGNPIPKLEHKKISLPHTVIGNVDPNISQILQSNWRINNLRHTA
ncbi:hypothetical protein EI77_01527 [Prosthecobacter fusiformis]|uniref:Uncharacterized protein n=1 Tax=Prosthecobacter fusiformis TaxID=48464 RepID=A0A4R7S3T6_9BACT|nr:hypothetical protein EI77_01527 [Prosthecobacter fusiformis]